MAGYIVSGAGNAAVNGLYEDRNSDVNGKPSYMNGSGWYLYYCESEIDIGEFTWVLCDSISPTTIDFNIGVIYGQTPWNLDTPADGTWYVGYWVPYNTPPAPTVVAYSVEDDPTDPGDEPEPDDEPGVVDEVPYVLLGEAGYGLRVLGAGDYAALLAEGSVGVRRVAVRRTLGV